MINRGTSTESEFVASSTRVVVVMPREMRFGDWCFGADTGEVTNGTGSVTLEPCVSELLEYFLENPAELLSHDRLVRGVWDGGNGFSERLNLGASEIEGTLAP